VYGDTEKFVYFLKTANIKFISSLINRHTNTDETALIIIVPQGNIDSHRFHGYKYELFTYTELQYMIFEFTSIVPFRIRLLNREEETELKQYYKTSTNFPHMVKRDPFRRFLDLKKHSFLEFERRKPDEPLKGEIVLYVRDCL
jgi:hypothetical protein